MYGKQRFHVFVHIYLHVPINKIYIHLLGCNTSSSVCVHSVWWLLTMAGNPPWAPLKYQSCQSPLLEQGTNCLLWNCGVHISMAAKKFCGQYARP